MLNACSIYLFGWTFIWYGALDCFAISEWYKSLIFTIQTKNREGIFLKLRHLPSSLIQ